MPKWLAKLLLRLNNMRVVDRTNGNFPKKCLIVVAPHTSNRDFPYGIYSRPVLGEKIQFVAKDSLFKGIMGPLMKWMGGIPVVRSKRTNFVGSVVEVFNKREDLKICIAVEGTREKVTHFKTGFYFIALEANIPLLLTRWDFGNRQLEFGAPYHLTGDIRKDFDHIYRHFDGVQGLNPENNFTYDPAVLDLLPEIHPPDEP